MTDVNNGDVTAPVVPTPETTSNVTSGDIVGTTPGTTGVVSAPTIPDVTPEDAPVAPASPAPTGERVIAHIVQEGETLESIAKAHTVDIAKLVGINLTQLDRLASAHGFHGSKGGKILFAGTRLEMPS